MQTLYSFFQHENADPAQFEKEMFRNLEKIHDLYLYILALIGDLHHVSLLVIDENRNKRLPSREDLNPNMKFAHNALLTAIAENKELKLLLEKKKISWQNDFDVVRKLYTEIRNGKLFKNYLNSKSTDIKEDRDFVIALITDHLSRNEMVTSIFEEKSMHWADDAFVAYNSVIRNFEDFNGEFKVQTLLRDEKDDYDFMSKLFNQAIIHRQEFEELIDKHTSNWELERIANMDMLLMEMALSEILYIPSVPIKASLNEYIDISKEYSTPNSKVFVNGVLDKIINQLKSENKITKIGRGLKES